MPIDFSRKLLELWGGTLVEQRSLGLTEEPKETEVTVPCALHVGETTTEIVDATLSNIDTAPVVNEAARKQEECRLDVTGKSTVHVGKEIG
jgi:hypothetical protein